MVAVSDSENMACVSYRDDNKGILPVERFLD